MKPITLFLFALSVFAQSSKPTEIPSDRKEEISQVMLTLQQSQLELLQMEIRAREAIEQAQKKVTEAQSKYDAMETDLRKEFSAEGCKLNLQKSWQCAEAKK